MNKYNNKYKDEIVTIECCKEDKTTLMNIAKRMKSDGVLRGGDITEKSTIGMFHFAVSALEQLYFKTDELGEDEVSSQTLN